MQPTRGKREDLLERVLVHTRENRRFCSDRAGGARLSIEQRHFAEEISCFDITERFLPTAASNLGNLHRAIAYEVKRIARIAFFENHFAGVDVKGAHPMPY